jgi:hypothetical protein
MWAEKDRYVLAVMPSANDMDRLRFDRKPVGERVGVTQPDAKIELRSLSDINPHHPPIDDGALPRTQLFDNGDLVIYLSNATINDMPSDGVRIERSAIETPLIADKEFRKGLLEAAIPSGGIVVDFTQMYSPRSHPH